LRRADNRSRTAESEAGLPLDFASRCAKLNIAGMHKPRRIAGAIHKMNANAPYIVVDGCSTDRTLEILEQFSDRVTIVHGPDAGQADALNRGFALARGEILGWLNADDLYVAGAIDAVVDVFGDRCEIGVVYGEADHIDAQGHVIDAYPVRAFDAAILQQRCFICQPAAFVRRTVQAAAGGLDPALHYALDYDLWIRLSRLTQFVMVPRLLAHSHMHVTNKTLGFRREAYEETMEVLRRRYGYVPYDWVYGYSSFLLDRKDQYFEASRATWPKVLLSLALGLARNPFRPLRFVRDWLSHRGFMAKTRRSFI
jgi:glycosyltransferase involved in cell wall biosynthesis